MGVWGMRAWVAKRVLAGVAVSPPSARMSALLLPCVVGKGSGLMGEYDGGV